MATTRFKVEVKGPKGWQANTVFNDYWLAQEDASRLEGKGYTHVRIVAEQRESPGSKPRRQVVYGEGGDSGGKKSASLGELIFTRRKNNPDRPKIHHLPFSDFLTVVLVRATIIAFIGIGVLFFTLHMIDLVMT